MSRELLQRVRTVDVSSPALIWRDRTYTYGFLLDEAEAVRRLLLDADVPRGAVVSLEGDYSPRAVAALLALVAHEAIVAPVGPRPDWEQLEGAAVELRLDVGTDESIVARRTGLRADHDLYSELRRARHPGLVLFSSGSNGRPKAVVHDVARLGARYRRPGRSSVICAFLAFDHIGGLNTLLYTLANGGCVAVPADRSPDVVCALIERHAVDVLPTTPTFLGLLVLSGACERFELSSLSLITYGTEVMPTVTLARLRERLPHARLLQTYGLSETGILATRSLADGSVWFTITAPGVETRVVDGVLHVRAPTTMLGYLDGSTDRLLPDGWFDTGDLVVRRGDFIRVLGRADDSINVGGRKVHPVEVENVVLELDGVVDARVRAEANAISGQHVRLEVVLATGETSAEFHRRLRQECSGRLEAFEVPQRVVVVDGPLHGHRYKKARNALTEPQRKLARDSDDREASTERDAARRS